MDIELLARQAAEGNEDAFHNIVDMLSEPLYRTAFSLCGNAHDAEDLLQETFIATFKAIESFRGESSLKTWITGIMIRQASNLRRRRAKRPIAMGEALPEKEGRNSDRGAALDIAQALQKLPDNLREAIVLREVQGLDYREISQALELPMGTVESRIYRARQQLQGILSAYRQVKS